MSEAEFMELYNRHLAWFKRYATNLKQGANAEDLLQDSFFKAWRGRESFKVGTNFQAWFGRVIRNEFINDFRKNKIRPRESDALYTLQNVGHINCSTSNEGYNRLLVSDLMKVMHQFENKQDLGVLLLRIEGYKYEEIASKTNLSLGTVKSKLFHTKRKLKIAITAHQSYNKGL